MHVPVEHGPAEAKTDGEIISEGIAGAHDSNSPLELFEKQLKLFVDVGLFFFAFVNAGVAFGFIGQVTIIVLLSLIVGKTVGVTLFSWIAVRLGFPLPTGMGIRHLAVTGLIAGIGLTVALFVAGKAFTGPPFQDPAKMGAVLSGGVALLALAAGAALKVKGSNDSD
jgi:NhaA family Na+:H+ antiporter